jgi:hypothetical protein
MSTVFVCVCVRASSGGQLARLDWKVGTHFWVFGQRSGPRADDPAFCASKKMQQDHHRFLNSTGPRYEATLLQRSPIFIYRFIGLSLGGRARDLIRCLDNSVRFAAERNWTSRQPKCRWLRQGDGVTTERLANNFFPGGQVLLSSLLNHFRSGLLYGNPGWGALRDNRRSLKF